MADKTGAFEGGDDIEDRGSPFQFTSRNGDSREPPTAVGGNPPTQTPLEECDQSMVDSSDGCSSNSSSAFADVSGSSPQSSDEVRLSEPSSRKRLKRTPLHRQKSTSPKTSYSKLSRNSAVDNVQRNEPDLEVMSSERVAYSANLQTVSMEISGSPRLVEPIPQSSSLVLPSSGHSSLTTVRPLSSEIRTSEPFDSNRISPVAQFATSSNPGQHATPAYLHQIGNTIFPSGTRIFNPPVQHSCHLPDLRNFPEHSPILNFPRHNRDPKGTRIQPLQEASSPIQVSEHQISENTASDKRHVSIEEFRTSSEPFLQKVDDKIGNLFRSSLVEPPKLLSNISAPSQTPLDASNPFEATLDDPEPPEAPLEVPGFFEALLDTSEHFEAPMEVSGDSETPLDDP